MEVKPLDGQIKNYAAAPGPKPAIGVDDDILAQYAVMYLGATEAEAREMVKRDREGTRQKCIEAMSSPPPTLFIQEERAVDAFKRSLPYIEKPPRPPLTRRRKEIRAERKKFVRYAKKYISRRYDIPKSWVKVRFYQGGEVHFEILPQVKRLSFVVDYNLPEGSCDT